MEVATVSLSPHVMIVLGNSGNGWRFANWVGTTAAMAELPFDRDRERLFVTPTAAAEFFKDRYAKQIAAAGRLATGRRRPKTC